MDMEEYKPVKSMKTLSTLSNQEFHLLITSNDPLAVKWRKLHKDEFKIRLKASDILNEFFEKNSFQ
jgi:lysyl-tRNA synthetase class II